MQASEAKDEDGELVISEYVRAVVIYHVGGLAFLTLLINAPTTGLLVKYLKLTEKTDV